MMRLRRLLRDEWGMSMRFSSRYYLANSHYDRKASILGVGEDEAITHWGVWDHKMRIGRARLRTGGIGVVSTRKDFRNQGLAMVTGNATIQAMRRQGYDLTMLQGIGNFYHRFGYVRAWSTVRYAISAQRFPSVDIPLDLRQIALSGNREAERLYNRHHRGLTGTSVRPTYSVFEVDRVSNPAQTWGWFDAGGALKGYVCTGLNEPEEAAGLFCTEAAGRVDEVLAALGILMRRKRQKVFRLWEFHQRHPLAIRLRQGDCRATHNHSANGDWMIRTVNLASALKRMSAEFRSRLGASGFGNWRGKLLIDDGRESVVLQIDRGRTNPVKGIDAPHAIRGGDYIAQLLIGTERPEAVASGGRIRFRGEGRGLADALFPAQDPMISRNDSY